VRVKEYLCKSYPKVCLSAFVNFSDLSEVAVFDMARFERFAASSFRDFNNVDELYRSTAGAVYRATFKYDDRVYVLKERVLSELGKRKNITNEVQLLAQLSHPNVIRCEGWFWDSRKQSLFIVLEYCEGGDLYKLIQKRKARSRYFSEAYIWHIFHQICLSVRHLHENGIVHRDLKALNIMLTRNENTVKLADLGVSRQVSEDTMLLNTFYGTPLYLSPELVDNSAYNEKTDIWSLGVILYELAALRCPFRSQTLLGLAKCIKRGVYDSIPDHFSPELSRCIKWLLQIDYTKRPHINKIVDWVEARLDPSYIVEVNDDEDSHATEGDTSDDDEDNQVIQEDEKQSQNRSQTQAVLNSHSNSGKKTVDLASGRGSRDALKLEHNTPRRSSLNPPFPVKSINKNMTVPASGFVQNAAMSSEGGQNQGQARTSSIPIQPSTVCAPQSVATPRTLIRDLKSRPTPTQIPSSSKLHSKNWHEKESKEEKDRSNERYEASLKSRKEVESYANTKTTSKSKKVETKSKTEASEKNITKCEAMKIGIDSKRMEDSINDVHKKSSHKSSKQSAKVLYVKVDRNRIQAALRRQVSLLRRLHQTRALRCSVETNKSHAKEKTDLLSPRRGVIDARDGADDVLEIRIAGCEKTKRLLEEALESGKCEIIWAQSMGLIIKEAKEYEGAGGDVRGYETAGKLQRPKTAAVIDSNYPDHHRHARRGESAVVSAAQELELDVERVPKLDSDHFHRENRHGLFGSRPQGRKSQEKRPSTAGVTVAAGISSPSRVQRYDIIRNQYFK
jgi:serine/threonine protein kinase